MRRVCVTGMGIAAPIGIGVGAVADALRKGRSGIREIDFGTGTPGRRVAGVVDIDFAAHLVPARIPGRDRVTLLALVAAQEAIRAAAVHGAALDLSQAGVYFGTGIGGVGAIESAYEEFFVRGGARVKPLTVVQGMNNAAGANVAIEYGCHGPSITYSTACASSALAIGEGYRAIRGGHADVVIAGGSEALLLPGMYRAWEALRTLALPDAANPAASCKPFAKNRTGLVLAEGAAVVILESEDRARHRGAEILAMLSGYGSRTDATHLTKPDAAGQAAAMRDALREAALDPGAIGYINAHGTATIAGDVAETQAIKAVFGEHAARIPVTSSKSMHGHAMGATGAIEFVVALLALRGGFIPPTLNLAEPDPECDLDYVPDRSREGVTLRHVMSNSFAFGGSNAVLIASRPPA